MGTSSSSCTETPVKVVYNRHLGDVLDPRSPTAGILRTPIEVLGSPGTPEARLEPGVQAEEEQRGESSGSLDPRSPTPGVNRTPLKPSVTEGLGSLAKQLTGMFISPEQGTGGDDGSPSGVEAADQLLDCEGEGEEPGAGTADPPAQTGRGQPVDTGEQRPVKKVVHRAQRPSSRARRSQPGRPQLVSGKGRCPLQLLKDDNSPTCTLVRRQVKGTLHSSGSPGELMPRTPLKFGHSLADKENHSSPWVSGEQRPCPP